MNVHHYLIFFMPVYFSMIALEHFIGRKKGLRLYTKEQSFASVVIAVGQNLLSLWQFGIMSVIWLLVYDHRLFEIDGDQWWYYPILFVSVDFFYYWYHRLSHEIRWLWATHCVHHSVTEMNLLAGYRFGWTERVSLGPLVFLPLLYLGFNPIHVVFAQAIILVYNSWLHSDLIGRLGWLEGVVNTPSAHRVHHGINPRYIDRNYGGVFMLWDRMFGTYQEELDDVHAAYGLLAPPPSANPLRVAFHEWVRIIRDLNRHKFRHWPALLFGPPGWAPDGRGTTSAQLRAGEDSEETKCQPTALREDLA
ncbi:sterol desaturase family protein [Erythrobacter sp.]|uniref:sterol desaturase family protein n=1 Tax=Erythrobacter sp. TaxID=1042 RepID=UPI003C780CDE